MGCDFAVFFGIVWWVLVVFGFFGCVTGRTAGDLVLLGFGVSRLSVVCGFWWFCLLVCVLDGEFGDLGFLGLVGCWFRGLGPALV